MQRPPPARAAHNPDKPLPDRAPSGLVPPEAPRLSWQYVWSFFMRAPRVRAWLFQKTPPPPTHLVQSLLSSPLLVGYIFGSTHENARVYSFPDIGDLLTVFCRDGDAFLGFNFGFQGVQPIMPLLFQVIKDPMLANPNVVVRRTAYQRAPYPFHSFFLILEFNWFESGALAVATHVAPIDSNADKPSGLYPYVQNAEHRIFTRRTAARLSAVAASLAEQVDLAFFPHPSHFADLPADFLDPPDDYYFLTVCEPDDSGYDSVLPAYVPPEQKYQTFEVEKEIPEANTPNSTATTANSSSTVATSQSGSTANSAGNEPTVSMNAGGPGSVRGMPSGAAGANLHCDRGEVSSVAEAGTMALWNSFQAKIAQSRRTGVLLTMLGGKTGGRYKKPFSMFGRESRYIFLSTSGINVHGRIQRLCSQLGIEFGSPLQDQFSLSGNGEGVDHGHVSDARQRYLRKETLESRKQDLDISGPSTGIDTTGVKQGFETGPMGVSSNGDVRRRLSLGAPPSNPQNVAVDLRAPTSANASCGALVTPDNDSLCYSRLGKESADVHGVRHPKRRRFAFSSEATPLCQTQTQTDAVQPALQEAPAPSRTPVGPSVPHPASQTQHQSLVEDSRQRQRSFHLTHILSSSDHLDQHTMLQLEEGSSGSDARASPPNAPDVDDGDERGEIPGHPNAVAPQDPPTKGKGSKTVWTCDRCGVQIRGKKGNLNRHIANKHENIRAFVCERPNCGRKFQTRLNLVRHETAVHEGRPHTCPSCPRAFKYEDDLQAHIKSAHDETEATLACEICGSCFGRRSTLNRHMTKVHKTKPQAQRALYT